MVIWTDYLRHRARVRGFDLAIIEQIVRFSEERYFDTITRRLVAIGRHGDRLVMVPYDQEDGYLTPTTILLRPDNKSIFVCEQGGFDREQAQDVVF